MYTVFYIYKGFIFRDYGQYFRWPYKAYIFDINKIIVSAGVSTKGRFFYITT